MLPDVACSATHAAVIPIGQWLYQHPSSLRHSKERQTWLFRTENPISRRLMQINGKASRSLQLALFSGNLTSQSDVFLRLNAGTAIRVAALIGGDIASIESSAR